MLWTEMNRKIDRDNGRTKTAMIPRTDIPPRLFSGISRIKLYKTFSHGDHMVWIWGRPRLSIMIMIILAIFIMIVS